MAKAAVGQICSSASMAQNLSSCVDLVRRAAAAGAKILFLPEASDYIAPSAQESLRLARPVAQSLFVAGLRSAAAESRIAVHVGIHVPVAVKPAGAAASIITANNPGNGADPVLGLADTTPVPGGQQDTETTTKLYNRTIFITADGALDDNDSQKTKTSYDKLHLFDYGALRESASTQAGAALTAPFASPVGRLGSLICFDLRFPEPALALARPGPGSGSGWSDRPAQVLLYPSAFTVPTGRAHWEVLLRARAIETGSWVIAAAQVGRHPLHDSTTRGKRVSYGRSLVVDPWGRVALELKGVVGGGDDEPDTWEAEDGAVGQLGFVDVDLDLWARVRERMPLRRRT